MARSNITNYKEEYGSNPDEEGLQNFKKMQNIEKFLSSISPNSQQHVMTARRDRNSILQAETSSDEEEDRVNSQTKRQRLDPWVENQSDSSPLVNEEVEIPLDKKKSTVTQKSIPAVVESRQKARQNASGFRMEDEDSNYESMPEDDMVENNPVDLLEDLEVSQIFATSSQIPKDDRCDMSPPLTGSSRDSVAYSRNSLLLKDLDDQNSDFNDVEMSRITERPLSSTQLFQNNGRGSNVCKPSTKMNKVFSTHKQAQIPFSRTPSPAFLTEDDPRLKEFIIDDLKKGSNKRKRQSKIEFSESKSGSSSKHDKSSTSRALSKKQYIAGTTKSRKNSRSGAKTDTPHNINIESDSDDASLDDALFDLSAQPRHAGLSSRNNHLSQGISVSNNQQKCRIKIRIQSRLLLVPCPTSNELTIEWLIKEVCAITISSFKFCLQSEHLERKLHQILASLGLLGF